MSLSKLLSRIGRRARYAWLAVERLWKPEAMLRVFYTRGWMQAAARLYPLLVLAQPIGSALGVRYAVRMADLFLLISDSLYMLGQNARAADAVQRAERIYEQVLRKRPLDFRANKGLALLKFYREQYELARAYLGRLVDSGAADAEVLTYLGRLHAEQDDFQRAREYFERAIVRDPRYKSVHTAYGNIRPFLGDFRGKWAGYDDIARKVPHHAEARLWRGEPLAGKSIAIFPFSGIGDEVRYACVYDRLISMAQKCTVFCEPRVEALFRRTFPDAEVRPLFRRHTYNVNNAPRKRPEFTPPPADYYTIAMNAIQFLFAGADECATRRRLQVDAEAAARWRALLRERAAGRRVVGIDWRSGLMLFKRRREYMELAEFAPILDVEGVLFVSLCYAGDEELRAFSGRTRAEILRPELDLRDDFDGLAALISSLDLVISAPTNIAELGGFIGTPTWLVESSPGYHYRWRIKADGSDIWFPNLLHFNRVLAGGREANIANAARALARRPRAQEAEPLSAPANESAAPPAASGARRAVPGRRA